MTFYIILFGLLLCLAVHSDENFQDVETDGEIYTNSWAVKLDTHDETVANEVAAASGFKNHGTIANLPGYFKFVHEQTPSRHKRSAEHHTQPLLDHPRVEWTKQQTLLFRYKRGFEALDRFTRAEENRRYFNDPEWNNEWYFGPLRADETRGNLGILEAVKQGYTGRGVVVTIVDDGLDYTHPDLKRNYDPHASYDVNDDDPDPHPNDSKPENAHGTKCSGEVAAEADNGVCGVGVAHNAKVGGIRMLDGPVTDVEESKALGFNCDYIDIFSASWGPKDDGKTFGKPEKMCSEVMKKCGETGRRGKGSLYVWASGNGGSFLDDCNCDGYVSSIYTLTIGSVSPNGFRPSYDENCPSTMAVVYTGDAGEGKREGNSHLVTTSLFHECVTQFSGTSCAAPLAAGIFALVLEANPELTWRDMQHLVVQTAKKNDPTGASWSKNGAGHFYSRSYGFGVLHAPSMIKKAKKWTHVPQQLSFKLPGTLTRDSAVIPSRRETVLKLNNEKDDISKLEHVQLVLSVSYRRRGDMVIDLVSPQGTTSRLLAKRPFDSSNDGLAKWPFASVEFWDEKPQGEWTVTIRDEKSENDYSPRHNDVMFDEGESPQRDQPNIANDLSHGRFKEDYMKVTKRSVETFPRRDDDLQQELFHGRFKDDYMKSADAPKLPNNVASDEGDWCKPSADLQGPVAGCVVEWSLVLYGTA